MTKIKFAIAAVLLSSTVNRLRLGFYAIQCLHRDKPQLVALDQFMDAILKEARP